MASRQTPSAPRYDGPVLVTGASGFLGEHLARRFAAAGNIVVGTNHHNPVHIPRADVIPIDIADAGSVLRLFRDLRPVAVFHCAALTDMNACERDPETARTINVEGTRALADAARTHTPQAPFVYVSTDLAFDGRHAPYREDDPPSPLGEYGRTKVEGEGIVLGLERGVVVRAPLIYGPPGTHSGGFLKWMEESVAIGREMTLFSDEVRSPVHVEDLCIALEFAALHIGERRVWHAAGPEGLTRVEMGRLLCTARGRDTSIIRERTRTEAGVASLRPRDVTLDSRRLWEAAGYSSRGFADGLKFV
jgi:dTDP-4-dehydrorhamnose reductase